MNWENKKNNITGSNGRILGAESVHFGLIWLDMKKGFQGKYRKPLISLVGREGFEPSANGLKDIT